MSQRSISGDIAVEGAASPTIVARGWVALHLTGTFTGQVRVGARRPGGSAFAPVSFNGANAATLFSGPVRAMVFEPEEGVEYRVEVPTLSSGTVSYALGQSA